MNERIPEPVFASPEELAARCGERAVAQRHAPEGELERRLLAALQRLVAKLDASARAELAASIAHDYQDGPLPEWVTNTKATGINDIRALIAEAEERIG